MSPAAVRQALEEAVPPARIGLIVPSSNVTVETEIPRILARASSVQFSFHSSRMRMHAVTPEQLLAMNAQRERCVLEIGDASVDALLYACLVAIMATGPGAHRDVELRIAEQLASGGAQACRCHPWTSSKPPRTTSASRYSRPLPRVPMRSCAACARRRTSPEPARCRGPTPPRP